MPLRVWRLSGCVRRHACMHTGFPLAFSAPSSWASGCARAHRLGLSHFLQDLRAQTWFARMHACMLASGRRLEEFRAQEELIAQLGSLPHGSMRCWMPRASCRSLGEVSPTLHACMRLLASACASFGICLSHGSKVWAVCSQSWGWEEVFPNLACMHAPRWHPSLALPGCPPWVPSLLVHCQFLRLAGE